MGIERQHESEKITGDKLKQAIDSAAAQRSGRKPGQGEADEEGEELDLEDRADTEADDTDDE